MTDDLLAVLADSTRRRLVRRLHDSADPVPLSDVTGDSTGAGDDRSDAVSFHHVHVPKLTDADVARYDPVNEEFTAGVNAVRATHLLDAVAGDCSADEPVSGPASPLVETCSTDEAFRLLANATRRFVLSRLDGTADRVHLEDLAERAAAWKAGRPTATATPDERTSAAVELHQRHLPMLSDAEVLEYDWDAKTLPRRGHPVAVAEWLRGCPVLEPFEKWDGI